MKLWKILFVGVGSIAKRHIKNVYELLNKYDGGAAIDIFRSGEGTQLGEDLTKLVNKTYFDYNAVPMDYDVIFITNPTQYHLDCLKSFYPNGENFFIEKPLCTVEQLKDANFNYLTNDKVYYVACPLRYTKVIQYVKNNLDMRKIRSIRSISSSYLPDWRPGTDYRKSYSAHKALGGGVSIDLIHEWDYICYLFGQPFTVHSIIKKVSNLEIDSDDIGLYIADYGDKTAELHIDYFGRKPIRKLELYMDDDTIECDLINSKITFNNNAEAISFEEERNDYQIEELLHFFTEITGKKYGVGHIEMAKTVLKLAGGTI